VNFDRPFASKIKLAHDRLMGASCAIGSAGNCRPVVSPAASNRPSCLSLAHFLFEMLHDVVVARGSRDFENLTEYYGAGRVPGKAPDFPLFFRWPVRERMAGAHLNRPWAVRKSQELQRNVQDRKNGPGAMIVRWMSRGMA